MPSKLAPEEVKEGRADNEADACVIESVRIVVERLEAEGPVGGYYGGEGGFAAGEVDGAGEALQPVFRRASQTVSNTGT